MRTLLLKLLETGVEEFLKKVNFEKAEALVPVVVQDASNDKVLMQAFMNKEALWLTLTSGKMHYWSRSRGRIWLKGEESGHHSLLQNAILDCDNDAILFKVQQIGTVCHTGQETCFHSVRGFPGFSFQSVLLFLLLYALGQRGHDRLRT